MSTTTHDSPAPYLSVVLPAYNEQTRLARSLPAIVDFLRSRSYTWEIIVVDDGSTDATAEMAERLLMDVPHTVLRTEPNVGKGAAIRRGMLAARGQWRLFTDADLSTPIEELDRFFELVKKDSQTAIVIGSRAMSDSNLAKRQPFYREFMGRIFNVCVQMLVLPGIYDTQCGFKLFSQAAAECVFPQQQLKGYAFDCELLMLARRDGFAIVECPVTWINDGASKVNPVVDSIKMLIDLWKLRKRLAHRGGENVS